MKKFYDLVGFGSGPVDDGQEGRGLFRSGKFTLHSGQESDFKIDCDSLSDSDLEALAFQIRQHRTFGEVYGVPKGGERIAEKLRRYIIEDSSVLLIVDDVMTTGNSMNEAYEKFKTKYDHIDGAVIFNRGVNLPWVHSVFTALPVADGDYVEGLKKLLRMADCPEILIENPYLLKGRKPTDADYAWAEGVIKRYKEHNKTINEAQHSALPVADGEGRNEKIKKEFSDNKEALLKAAKGVHEKMKSSAVTGVVRPFVWTDELVEELIWDEYGDNAVRFKVDKFKQYKSQPAQGKE